ncbi:MAG: TRAP transporter large permease [Dehalococcoidales bacterium]|nr:TRAP transporter large permease [Dehalococcoidales bacterium]
MGQTEIGLIGIAAVLIILIMGVHVGFGLIIVGFIGYGVLNGFHGAIANLAILTFSRLNDYHFAVLPLFLLMGSFVANSGIGREAYQMARAWLGQLKGGLAMATVFACALIAACAGTSGVGAILMGQVAYPEMKKLGYSKTMSAGCIAAGGTMGILIPPSMGFVLIGILTELSIGKLFMAGIIPGILEAVFYVITIMLMCRINPKLAPSEVKTTWKEKVFSIKLTWPVFLLFILIMGGIYGGIFTPTEAGGIGAFGALIIGLAKRQLGLQGIWESLMECARLVGMIVVMLVGAYMFNAFLATTQIPTTISEFISGLPVPPMVILIAIIIFYIICGMFFDVLAVLILTIPIIYPLVESLGFDLIWYSVIMVRIIEIGQITPPFGINLFILTGVINEPLGVLYRGIIPFVIADICHVALLVAVPSLSTFLPSLM